MPDMLEGRPPVESAYADEEVDNGFADPAQTDVDADNQEETALTFEEQFAHLLNVISKHPLNSEIMHKTLKYCTEERLLADVEREIASFPEFSRATQNQYHMVSTLVKAGGLDFIERDEAGNLVTPERKAGLTEDEIDELVATWSYRTTELGNAAVADRTPFARFAELVDYTAERKSAYIDVLKFVAEAPRSIKEVEALLEGRPEMQAMVYGRMETLKASVFVDKLGRAGVLVWDGKWRLTQEGEEILAELTS